MNGVVTPLFDSFVEIRLIVSDILRVIFRLQCAAQEARLAPLYGLRQK